MNRVGVVALLRTLGPSGLDLDNLSDDDRRTILDECKDEDFDVVRSLRIHATIDGSRVAIDDRCYWRGSFPIDGDLAEGVIVLEPDRKEAIAAKQREIHSATLDAEGVIRLILKNPEPFRRGRRSSRH